MTGELFDGTLLSITAFTFAFLALAALFAALRKRS
jgi:hypothetical protein